MDSYHYNRGSSANTYNTSGSSSTIPALFDHRSREKSSNYAMPADYGTAGSSSLPESRAEFGNSRKEMSASQLDDAAFAARVLGLSDINSLDLPSNLMTGSSSTTSAGASYGMQRDTDQQQIRSVSRDVPSFVPSYQEKERQGRNIGYRDGDGRRFADDERARRDDDRARRGDERARRDDERARRGDERARRGYSSDDRGYSGSGPGSGRRRDDWTRDQDKGAAAGDYSREPKGYSRDPSYRSPQGGDVYDRQIDSRDGRRSSGSTRESRQSVEQMEAQARIEVEAQVRAEAKVAEIQLQTQSQLQETLRRLQNLEETQAKKDRQMKEMENMLRKRKMDEENNFRDMKHPRMEPMPPHPNHPMPRAPGPHPPRDDFFDSGDSFRMPPPPPPPGPGRDPFAHPYPEERPRYSPDRGRPGQGSGIRPLLPGLSGMPPDAQRMSSTACYNCGQEGHIAKKCPGKQPCFKCGKTGHAQKDCPESKKGSFVCYKCGKEGHIAKNCTSNTAGSPSQTRQQQRGQYPNTKSKGEQPPWKGKQQQKKGIEIVKVPYMPRLVKRYGLGPVEKAYRQEMARMVKCLLGLKQIVPPEKDLTDAVICFKCCKEGHRQIDCKEPNTEESLESGRDMSANTVAHQVKLLTRMKYVVHMYNKKLHNLKCYICDVKCKDMEDYYLHLDKGTHEKNVEKVGIKSYGDPGRIDLAMRLFNLPSVFSKDEGDKAQNKDEDYSYFCRVCLAAVPGPLEKHEQNSAHQIKEEVRDRCVTCNIYLHGKNKDSHERGLLHKEMLKARVRFPLPDFKALKAQKLKQAKSETGIPVGTIMGRSFVFPAKGVFCRVCGKFFANMTIDTHCKLPCHHRKLWKWCHEKKQMTLSEVLEMFKEDQPSSGKKGPVSGLKPMIEDPAGTVKATDDQTKKTEGKNGTKPQVASKIEKIKGGEEDEDVDIEGDDDEVFTGDAKGHGVYYSEDQLMGDDVLEGDSDVDDEDESILEDVEVPSKAEDNKKTVAEPKPAKQQAVAVSKEKKGGQQPAKSPKADIKKVGAVKKGAKPSPAKKVVKPPAGKGRSGGKKN